MVVGEAPEVDGGGADAAIERVQNAIAPLPNNMAPSSGLIVMASVNFRVAVGDTEMILCVGSDAVLRHVARPPLPRACQSLAVARPGRVDVEKDDGVVSHVQLQ